MEAKEPYLAIAAFKHLTGIAPEEPQFYRDLRIAWAEAGISTGGRQSFAGSIISPMSRSFPMG